MLSRRSQERIVEVVIMMLQELVLERVVEQNASWRQIVDVLVLRFMEEIVETVAGHLVCKLLNMRQHGWTCRLLAKAQAALFFFFFVVISWCKRWILEHVVLDLFSHIKTR